MRGRPVGLPEHLNEELIGNWFQSCCYECHSVTTFNIADGAKAIKTFRDEHRHCGDNAPVSANEKESEVVQ